MPYIDSERRLRLNHGATPQSLGELAYCITRMVLDFLPETPHFSDYGAALGVLEATKLELYRRRVGPYENFKREEHGDVYHLEPDMEAP